MFPTCPLDFLIDAFHGRCRFLIKRHPTITPRNEPTILVGHDAPREEVVKDGRILAEVSWFILIAMEFKQPFTK
jgi:hypothetical protein